jgi:DNA-binding transcriptional LysR family regulator
VLGIRLVERTTRSLRLTPAGRDCYAAAVEALAALEAVATPARGSGRPLRLGWSWAAFGPWTTDVLRAWREQEPGTPREMHRVDDRDAGLRAGLVNEPVHVEPLVTEGRLAAVPAGSPLASRAELTLTELADEVVALAPAARWG